MLCSTELAAKVFGCEKSDPLSWRKSRFEFVLFHVEKFDYVGVQIVYYLRIHQMINL